MGKLYVMLMMFSLLACGGVFADVTYYEDDYGRTLTTDSSFVEVTKLRYESYPVSPGDYFTFYLQVQKTGSVNTDVKFEIVEEYPFSLDSNEVAVRSFSNLNNEPVVLEYKIRVDDSAVAGENTLKVRQTGSGASLIREFDIMVLDVQTSFDAVIQENVAGEISIALANIGMNDAGAAIVRIPDQEGVRVTGNDAQMVGNLDQGDYTIVGFSVTGISKVLKMQVDYTDTIGVRRSEIVEMSFDGESSVMGESAAGMRSGNGPGAEVEESTGWMTWLVYVFIAIVLIFIGNKYFRGKTNGKKDSLSIPEWMGDKKRGAKK